MDLSPVTPLVPAQPPARAARLMRIWRVLGTLCLVGMAVGLLAVVLVQPAELPRWLFGTYGGLAIYAPAVVLTLALVFALGRRR